jgi:hypothetical protein
LHGTEFAESYKHFPHSFEQRFLWKINAFPGFFQNAIPLLSGCLITARRLFGLHKFNPCLLTANYARKLPSHRHP